MYVMDSGESIKILDKAPFSRFSHVSRCVTGIAGVSHGETLQEDMMEQDETATVQDHRDEECAGFGKERGTMPGASWRRYGWSIVLTLTLALLGCSGDDEPTLTGTWTGTIQDSVAGTGTALFTFSQTGTNVNGTWQFTFQNPANNNGGTLSGTAGNPAIALTLFAAQSQACSFTVVANFDEDDKGHFTGTYTARNCSPLQDGNLDVHRQ